MGALQKAIKSKTKSLRWDNHPWSPEPGHPLTWPLRRAHQCDGQPQGLQQVNWSSTISYRNYQCNLLKHEIWKPSRHVISSIWPGNKQCWAFFVDTSKMQEYLPLSISCKRIWDLNLWFDTKPKNDTNRLFSTLLPHRLRSMMIIAKMSHGITS